MRIVCLLLIFCFYVAGCDQSNWATTPAGRLEHASKQLDAAKNDFDRFVALGAAAKESFASGHIDDANRFAKELLQRAPHYRANMPAERVRLAAGSSIARLIRELPKDTFARLTDAMRSDPPT
jgi:hypothetical protein